MPVYSLEMFYIRMLRTYLNKKNAMDSNLFLDLFIMVELYIKPHPTK